jgi:hypothetical protein
MLRRRVVAKCTDIELALVTAWPRGGLGSLWNAS